MARIAHVGHGYWGRNIARNLSELGVLAAIVDDDPEVARQASANYDVPSRDFDFVLNDQSVDAISFATPAVLHARHACRALEEGKHVFVEKPLALNLDDALKVCGLAKRTGRKLMVGHLLQYHPVFAALRKMVEQGELGRIRYAYSNRLSLGKFRGEENAMWSLAPHDFSMLLSLFNEEPLSVCAHGNVSFLPGVADFTNVQLDFPSGGSAHVLSSWMHPFKEQRLVVIGEKSAAIFDDAEPEWEKKLVLYRHSFDISGPLPVPRKADLEYVSVPKSEPLRNECCHFVECVDRDLEPITNGEEGLRVLKVLQAADAALAEHFRNKAELK